MSMPQHSTPDPGPALAPTVHEFTASGPIDATLRNLRGDVVLRAEDGDAVRVELRPLDQAGRDLVERMRIDFDGARLTVDAPSDEPRRVSELFTSGARSDGSWTDQLLDGLRGALQDFGSLRGQLDLIVVVPTGSRVVLHDGAGDLAVSGQLGRLEARTGAGDIALECGAAQETRLNTGSGDIAAGPTPGDLTATTGAGDIAVGPAEGAVTATTGTGDVILAPVAGPVSVTTGAGDVDLAQTSGEVSVTTSVGDIEVRRAASGRITARSGVGDVTVRVVPGTATRVELATGLGDRDVALDPADGAGAAERTLEIEAKTGKGDLKVLRADS